MNWIDRAMDAAIYAMIAILAYGAYAWLRWAWRELRRTYDR